MGRCAPYKGGPHRFGDRRRIRVGLLGGSFNPAHDGHRHVAVAGLKELALDQVWLLVSPQNPLKSSVQMAGLADRLGSAADLCAGHPRLIASDLESRLGTRFTIHTLRILRRRFPRMDFVWLMGADNLAQAHLWRRWADIWRAMPVAIVARPAYALAALASRAARRFARFRLPQGRAAALFVRPRPAWIYLHTRLHPASSTRIRAQLSGENP